MRRIRRPTAVLVASLAATMILGFVASALADSLPITVPAPPESVLVDTVAPSRTINLKPRDDPRRRITLRPDLETGLWLALFAVIGGLASAAVQGGAGYLFRRQTAHYDGLMRLQFQLTIASDRLAANKGRIKKVRHEMMSGVMVFVFPSPFRIDETFQHDVYNQTLLNEVLRLNMHLVRFNDALAGLRSGYETLRDNHIQHQDDDKSKANYEVNVERMEKGARQLEAHLTLLETKIGMALARVRVHLREENVVAKLLRRWLLHSNDTKQDQVEKELARMIEKAAPMNAALKREMSEALSRPPLDPTGRPEDNPPKIPPP